MVMNECASAVRHLFYFIFILSGTCADQLLINRVGRLNVLHHPHPVLLLIERPTTNEPRTPHPTFHEMATSLMMTSLRLRLSVVYL